MSIPQQSLELDQILPQPIEPAGQTPFELMQRRPRLRGGRRLDQITDRLGLDQIHLAIQDGAAVNSPGCAGRAPAASRAARSRPATIVPP